MDYQDWNEVKIGGGKISNDPNKKTTELPPINKQNEPGSKLFKQLDSEEIYIPPKIDKNVSRDIQSKRNQCKLTQKELANAFNIPTNIINDIESGKSTQNKGLINKINKFLDNKIKKNQS
jgi:ribosome-binding protein aMBF1 (putative translation factor)